jgi:hypothetical protein
MALWADLLAISFARPLKLLGIIRRWLGFRFWSGNALGDDA